jgi:serpin B
MFMRKALLSIVVLLGACRSSAAPSTNEPTPASATATPLATTQVPMPTTSPNKDQVGDLARALDAFAVDLQRATKDAPGNVVVSPASIAAALSMTEAGARGPTAAEMAKALHVDGTTAAKLHDDWQALLSAWTTPDPKGVTLEVANRLFAANDYALDPAYVSLTRDRYGAPIQTLDFGKSPEPARATINAWVSAQTNKKIESLLSAGSIDDQTKLVLVNAIHFKGAWEDPFTAAATAPATFHAPGKDVQAPTMHGMKHAPYVETADAQIVALPFLSSPDAKRDLELDVVLPKSGKSIADLESTYATLGATIDAATWTSVQLDLPKFSVKSHMELAPTLRALGIVRAFDPDQADFTGISKAKPPLYISEVVHEATIDVDEKGCEAAAATAILMKAGAAMPSSPVTMTVDRPFGVVLRDRTSGAILFVARIIDPTH